MLTNVFSNFNLIDAFNNGKMRHNAFGSKRFLSMLRSVRTYLSGEGYASKYPVAQRALNYYLQLVQDEWTLTDRDFFYMISDTADICFEAETNYQVLSRIVHCLAYLPLDVEGNGTLARRYKEVMCADREKPDAHLHEYAAALAVFMYVVERIGSLESAETWIRHHWRFEKHSNIATISMSMLRHSPADFHYAVRTASRDEAIARVMKWTAEVLACIYSRMYVPAVLNNCGAPLFRVAFEEFVIGGCHADN